jgi:RNA polymerase sigma-70 factor (ECF subfamily)
MGWKLFGNKSADSLIASHTLLTKYRDNADPQLLTQLFQRYADALYHFLLRQSDAELAQDISQQCWLNLMQYASGYQGQSSVKTWLFAIGRHLLIDEFRRQQRWQQVDETETLPDLQPSVLALLQRMEAQQRLDQAIGLLPYVQREALMLQLEEFSLEQIADITGSGVETVKTRLRYARQHLKSLLETVDEIG